ncbi:MAG: MerR family transcriptional regulator, partial [Actinomycetes bacterium]
MTTAVTPPQSPDLPAATDPSSDGPLLGIGKAAEELGVSERALRYYQQIGLLTPSGRTPGGLRRYSAADLDRVRRIRELQRLLG